MTLESDFADFMADPDRVTFTVSGLPGVSLSKMAPEDELADYLSGQEPHVARIDAENGVMHVRVFPDRESAGSWATGLAIDEYKNGSPVRGLTIKPRHA